MAEASLSNYGIALSVLSWTDKAKDPVIYKLFSSRGEKAVDEFVDVLLADVLGLSSNGEMRLRTLPAALKQCGLRDISICRTHSATPLPCREAYRLFASYLCLRENMDKMLDYVKNEEEMVKRSRREKRMGVLNRIQHQFQIFDERNPGTIWKGFQEETDRSFLWLGKYKVSRDFRNPTTYDELEACVANFLFVPPQSRPDPRTDPSPKRQESKQGDNPPPPPSFTVGFIDYIKRYLSMIVFTIFGEVILSLQFSEWWLLLILITIFGFGWLSNDEESVFEDKLLHWGKYSGNLMIVVPWLNKFGIISFGLAGFIIVVYPIGVVIWNYFSDIYGKHEHYPKWYPWIPILVMIAFPLCLI